MSDTARQGTIHSAGSGERYFAMGEIITILAEGNTTGGRFALVEHRVPPMGGPPLHTHVAFETLHILAGNFDVWLNGLPAPRRAKSGDTILVPPGVAHRTRNAGPSPGRFLSVYVPAGDEGFFQEIGTPVDELASPPNLDEPPDYSDLDPNRVREVAEKYGMRLVSPD